MKLLLLILVFSFTGNTLAAPQPKPMNLALSAVFLGEQQGMIVRWKKYLEVKLQRPVEFVQRRSYRELVDMFKLGSLDAGWVCGAPYVLNKSSERLLAVPVWKGRPYYQSYLIVPKSDTTTRSMADLRNKIFAYSDPDSNSGHNVPQGDIIRLGADPATFFKKTMFTYAHNKSVEAVAAGLADGARVDGYIYDQLVKLDPELTAQTRLVDKSDDYGFPPMVTRADLPAAEFMKLRTVLLNMQNDAEGRILLAAMGLDKFIAGNEQIFDGVAALIAEIKAAGDKRAR